MFGLVLEGGGAKGAYQIGVWQALKVLGIEINAVTGTSIGAINGAFIALDLFQEAYDIWYNIDMSLGILGDAEAIKKLVKLDISSKNYREVLSFFKKSIADRGIDISPMKDLLKKEINEEELRKSKVDYGLVTLSLSGFKPMEIFVEDIPIGKLHDYIIASANLPIFKLDKIDGKFYLDGGFYDNLPINLMASKGHKNIIAIKGRGVGRIAPVIYENLNIITIEPSGDTGKVMDFYPERARENIKMGYYDTLKVFKCYKGNKYYIKFDYSEDYIIEFFTNIEDEVLDNLKHIFSESLSSNKRMLFEDLIPMISKALKINEKSSYSDVFIAMLEFLAIYLKIDRYQVFTIDSLLFTLKSKLELQTDTKDKLLNSKKMDTFTNKETVRDEQLVKIIRYLLFKI